MTYQIRFNGRIAQGVYREAFVVDEWPDTEREKAMDTWHKTFEQDMDAYELLHLVDEANMEGGQNQR
jgi:hypothetical protein